MSSLLKTLGFLILLLIAAVRLPLALGAAELVRELEFSWQAVDRASGYELQFQPAGKGGQGSDPITHRTTVSTWRGKLPVGTYKLRMRTIDRRRVPGAWSVGRVVALPLPAVVPTMPKPKAIVKSTETDKAKVLLQWRPLGAGVRYKVEVRDEGGKVAFAEDVDENEAEVELPVSKSFAWSVIAVAPDDTQSESWKSPLPFSVEAGHLESPEVLLASDRFVKWSRPNHSEHFAVNLAVLDEASGKWQVLFKNKTFRYNVLKLDNQWPEGRYRLVVAAQAPLRSASLATTYDFETGVRAELKGKHPSPHQVQLGYAFAPMMRTVALLSDTTNVVFNDVTFNSHVLSASYLYLAYPHGIGLDFRAHLARGEIFSESAQTESLGEQKPLALDSNDFRLLSRYQFTVWRLLPQLALGAERHNLDVLYANGLTAFNLETTPITDLLVGPGLGIVLGPNSLADLHYLIGRSIGAIPVENYQRSTMELSFKQRLLDDEVLASFSLGQDQMQFDFSSPADAKPYRSVWSNRLISAGATYAF